MRERTKAIVLALLLCACGHPGMDAYNEALAALSSGDLSEAEAGIGQAIQTGDEEIVARAEFLRGNVQFTRCLTAEQQATAPGAEPFAFDIAIAFGETALRSWRFAAMSRDDWPEARRNVERALLKLEELVRKKRAKKDETKQTDPQPRPRPKPKPTKPEDKRAEDSAEDPQLKELSPEEVLRLIEKLAQKEREKLSVRRSHRKTRMAGVERDW